MLWFCERYKEWTRRLKPTLRQVHIAGEKLFVDYSGHTMEMVDGLNGEVRSVQIFVAVLGASNYTYAESSLTRILPDWIASGRRKGKIVSTSRAIAPPAHRPLPRASLRRSWRHFAPRTNPSHGPPG
ncbi:hypothetical protein [Bradyrhizobium sp. F1.13.3]|uniref:hypothetical protein n=1 Tax=Bradyrhizobium sp. F1.13.3 TaxID=3156351 RepID=UPI003396DEFB